MANRIIQTVLYASNLSITRNGLDIGSVDFVTSEFIQK